MKKIGIVLLVVGIAISLFTGFNLITKKNVVDIGDLQISVNESHRIEWEPIVGVLVIVAGAAFYLVGRKK